MCNEVHKGGAINIFTNRIRCVYVIFGLIVHFFTDEIDNGALWRSVLTLAELTYAQKTIG